MEALTSSLHARISLDGTNMPLRAGAGLILCARRKFGRRGLRCRAVTPNAHYVHTLCLQRRMKVTVRKLEDVSGVMCDDTRDLAALSPMHIERLQVLADCAGMFAVRLVLK